MINGRPNENKLTANVIRIRVKSVRKFFRFNKISITLEDFNELVSMPRKEQPTKKGIEKIDVAKYLNSCKNIQLKTALHVIASNGPRPIEPCAVMECDVDLTSDPATITYTAEYSKMRVARTRPLTREAANQLRLWLKFKYRTRWTTVKAEEDGESVRKFVTPKRNPRALLLSIRHLNGREPTPEGLSGEARGIASFSSCCCCSLTYHHISRMKMLNKSNRIAAYVDKNNVFEKENIADFIRLLCNCPAASRSKSNAIL